MARPKKVLEPILEPVAPVVKEISDVEPSPLADSPVTPNMDTCRACNGEGLIGDGAIINKHSVCSACGGSGKVAV